MNHFINQGYQDLADAIVLAAVEDWRRTRLQLAKPALASKMALDTNRRCEKFFASSWFTVLTDLDGKVFLRRLKEGFSFK